jgi:hypothetical protein
MTVEDFLLDLTNLTKEQAEEILRMEERFSGTIERAKTKLQEHSFLHTYDYELFRKSYVEVALDKVKPFIPLEKTYLLFDYFVYQIETPELSFEQKLVFARFLYSAGIEELNDVITILQ